MKHKLNEYGSSAFDVFTDVAQDAIKSAASPEAVKKRAVDNAIYYIQENLRRSQTAILNTNQVMTDDQAMQLVKSLITTTQAKLARQIEAQRRLARRRAYTEAIDKNVLQPYGSRNLSAINLGIHEAQNYNPAGQPSTPASTTYTPTPGAATTPGATIQQQQLQTPPPNVTTPTTATPTRTQNTNGSYIMLAIISGAALAFGMYPKYSSAWVNSLPRYSQLISDLNEVSQNIRKDSRTRIMILPPSMRDLQIIVGKFYNLALSESQRDDTSASQNNLVKNAARYGYQIKQVVLANNQNAALGKFQNQPVVILLKNRVQMNFYKNNQGKWQPFYSVDPATMKFVEPDPKFQYDTRILDNVKNIFSSVNDANLEDINSYKQFELANGPDNLTQWSSITESYNKLNKVFEQILKHS